MGETPSQKAKDQLQRQLLGYRILVRLTQKCKKEITLGLGLRLNVSSTAASTKKSFDFFLK